MISFNPTTKEECKLWEGERKLDQMFIYSSTWKTGTNFKQAPTYSIQTKDDI